MWHSALLVLVALCAPGGGFFVPPKVEEKPKTERCTSHNIYGMRGADCRQRNLLHVPGTLTSDIQVLDLTVNRIRELHNTTFMSYTSLRYLYLEDNSISYIETGAFEPLYDLEVLDLAFNSLHAVPDALQSLQYLRKLKMDRNPFASVMFLDPLRSVEYLGLSDCRLTQLPSLEALPRLLTLNISLNRIKNVDVHHHLAPLCRLRELDLRGNKDLFKKGQDFCDCTLLVKWSLMRNIKTTPATDVICLKSRTDIGRPVDNSTCFNNQTDLLFEESSLVARSCEAAVLAYGSGPIRLRSSMLWTLGIFGAFVVLIVCFASVYFVRRRQNHLPPEDDSDFASRSITHKSRS